MEFTNNNYKAPQARVLEVNVRRVLCLSETEANNTEKVTLGSYSYGDDDFE